jgi:hypothetical protein
MKCWFFHNWSKWSTPEPFAFCDKVQHRRCNKCGLVNSVVTDYRIPTEKQQKEIEATNKG